MKKEPGWIIYTIACLILFAISWLGTCGLVYILAWCFSMSYSMKVATGIWLIWLFASLTFSATNKK